MPDSPATDLDTFLDDLRAFMNAEIYPLEPDLMDEGFGAIRPALQQARRTVKKRGWWCPQLSTKHGGMGLSLEPFGRVSEELGRSPIGHYAFNCQAPDAGNMEILADHATPEQHTRYFEPLRNGDIRSCFAMTEPGNAGSNPKQLSTTARRDGDDYVINGHKWFTTGADGANFAIVMVITNPDAENPYARASQIIVPMDTEGLRHIRRIPVMGDEGEGWLSHSELRFDDCRVPQENLLGDEGAGFRIAQERLGPGRIHHCMRWIGIAERAFEMMCERATTRKLEPGTPLGSKQSVQHSIAECRAAIDASRMLVIDAARTIDQKGAKAARTKISTIKFYVADMLQTVLDQAIQVHGGLGMTDDTLLSFWYRHERGARIYDGPDEVHKSVVARSILKQYGMNV